RISVKGGGEFQSEAWLAWLAPKGCPQPCALCMNRASFVIRNWQLAICYFGRCERASSPQPSPRKEEREKYRPSPTIRGRDLRGCSWGRVRRCRQQRVGRGGWPRGPE